jgi:hypothetical protein
MVISGPGLPCRHVIEVGFVFEWEKREKLENLNPILLLLLPLVAKENK